MTSVTEIPGDEEMQNVFSRLSSIALTLRNVSLATLSRWRIGGPADIVVRPKSCEEAAGVLQFLNEIAMPYVIAGDGSNILFDDAGLRVPLVVISRAFDEFVDLGRGRIKAGAGLWVPTFVRKVISCGLKGPEHAIGIPGTLGGLIVMNGGSQRKGIGDQLVSVTVIDEAGKIKFMSREDCKFSYRQSALQNSGLLLAEAEFLYEAGDVSSLRRAAVATLAERKRKFPRYLPNCGSVFISDPRMYETVGPPGFAIESVGLKGHRIGDAEISPLHANFIVNRGQARSSDVLALIHLMRRKVLDETGFSMPCEVRHMTTDGTLRPAHLSAM